MSDIRQYQNLLDHTSDLIQSVGADGSFVLVNRAWQQTLGYTEQEVAGLKVFDIIHPQFKEHCLELFQRVMAGEPLEYVEAVFMGKDGQPIYLEGSSRPVLQENGRLITQSIFRDVSQRKLMESVLWHSEQELGTILENIPDSILRINRNHVVVYANPAIEQTTGIPRTQFLGRPAHQLGIPEEVYLPLLQTIDRIFESGQAETSEIYHETPIGMRHFDLHLVPEFGDDGLVETALIISRDITKHKELEDQLRDLSLNDQLTGLLNRRGFLIHAEQQLKLTQGKRSHGSWLIFADLDGLKEVNDRFGHAEGDWALVNCADMMRRSFRNSDIVARLSGDEFVALVLETSQADKDIILNRLHRKIEECSRSHQKPYQMSLSIGSTHISADHTAELEALIAQADQAMYREKQRRVTSDG